MKITRNGALLAFGLAAAVLLGRPAPAFAQSAFHDLPTDNPALSNALQDLAAESILRGAPDGKFDGQRAISRGECFLVLNRVILWFDGQLASKPAPYSRAPAKEPLPAAGPFADVPTNKDSETGDAVHDLAHLGVLQGYPDQTLGLRRPMTEAEFATARGRLQRWTSEQMVRLRFAPAEQPTGSEKRP